MLSKKSGGSPDEDNWGLGDSLELSGPGFWISSTCSGLDSGDALRGSGFALFPLGNPAAAALRLLIA